MLVLVLVLVLRVQAKGMWNSTLMVFSSDNGGQAKWPNAAGANMPLRGGKYSPWEGGVRVAAFVSGGALPPAVRGTRQQGLIHGVRPGLCMHRPSAVVAPGRQKCDLESSIKRANLCTVFC